MTNGKYDARDVELTLNMWGVSKTTIYRLRKNVEKGLITTFKNGMSYNPLTKIFA